MNAAITSVVVGVITYLGRTARGKPMSINVVVGIVGLAIMLAIIEQADRELAKKFGMLVIVGTLIAHWPIIAKSTGLKGDGK